MRGSWVLAVVLSLSAGALLALESVPERTKTAAEAPELAAPPPAPDPWRPPAPPPHAKRELDTAADLAADLQQVVRFLEDGQAYYRAFRKGSHSVEENKRFLKFLEAYESESAAAKKEVDALRRWVYERSGLETAAP